MVPAELEALQIQVDASSIRKEDAQIGIGEAGR